jgi:hypothetical protein
MFALFPDERQSFIVFLHPHSLWDRIMIFGLLLHPMMGRQEAHLQIRYVLAVGDFNEVHPSFVILTMELERECTLDV